MGVADSGPCRRVYSIAGLRVACNIELDAFAPFRLGETAKSDAPSSPFPSPPWSGGPARPLYQVRCDEAVRRTQGWLVGAERTVSLDPPDGAGRQRMAMAGVGEFTLNGRRGAIRCERLDSGLGLPELEEAVLGPPLTLALAERGVWCLHGAALEYHGRAVLISGRSGSGKSTLARYCQSAAAVQRLADDILPCCLADETVNALPRFPQLKLPASAQWGMDSPSRLPLGMLLFLDPLPAGQSVELIRLSPIDAIKRLSEQTVAITLYAPEMRERHLDFAIKLCQRLPVFLLRNPHEAAALPLIFEQIAQATRAFWR